MNRKFLWTLGGILIVLLAAGCGDGDNGNGDDAGIDAGTDAGADEGTDEGTKGSITATVAAPADFTGTPRSLLVAGFTSVPPAGPPAAIFGTVDSPTIDIGTPYALELTDLEQTGDLFIVITLYMEGGGITQPAAGIDYTYTTTEAKTFDGASQVALGTVTLELYNP